MLKRSIAGRKPGVEVNGTSSGDDNGTECKNQQQQRNRARTATRNVWWVQFYNSQDALILNSIEVTAMPEVAVAAPEDIAD